MSRTVGYGLEDEEVKTTRKKLHELNIEEDAEKDKVQGNDE